MFIQQLFKDNDGLEEIYGRSTLDAVGFYNKCNATYPEAKSYEQVCKHVKICRESDDGDEEDANSYMRDFIIMRNAIL